MNFALILVCSLTATISSIAIRLFQQKLQKSLRHLYVFQFSYTLICAVVYLIMAEFRPLHGQNAWLLAIAFAACLSVCTIGTSEMYLHGPMSLSSVIVSCNILMPIVFGCVFYNETLKAVHIIGCLFLMATLILSGIGPKEEKKEIRPRWYLMVAMAFLGNGFGAVVLNAYGKLYVGAGNNAFLGISFLLSATVLFFYIFLAGGKKSEVKEVYPPLFFLLIGISAAGCFGTNVLLLHLTGMFPASILYPVYNGGSSVMVSAISCLVFREPMNRKKLVTVLLGVCAVVLLNL